MMASLVLITYGTSGWRRFSDARCQRFGKVWDLRQDCSRRHLSICRRKPGRFNVILPRFNEAKAQVENLAYGDLIEFVPEPAE